MISLQFSRIRDQGKMNALRELMRPLPGDVKAYIERFRSSLSDHVYNDMEYSYRVFLVPNVLNNPRDNALAVEFVHYDPENAEHQDMIRRLTVFVRDRQVPVAHHGMLKPTDVASRVAVSIGRQFRLHEHTKCWKLHRVRPNGGSATPDKTDGRYCHFDEPHGDYLYTEAWVEFLIRTLSDDAGYVRMKNSK